MMRAKMHVYDVEIHRDSEQVVSSEKVFMRAVGPSLYPDDGRDENNSFARWTPSGDLSLVVSNPDLFGKIKKGQEFYLDFTAIKKLEDWQERVVTEKADLDQRLEALTKYVADKAFEALPENQKTLLLKQKKSMTAYSNTLGERIASF